MARWPDCPTARLSDCPTARLSDGLMSCLPDGLIAQVAFASRVLQLMNAGTLMLDEVDWLLHPLKSELNWCHIREA
eukprot:4059083-Prymnesium_polylepis.2